MSASGPYLLGNRWRAFESRGLLASDSHPSLLVVENCLLKHFNLALSLDSDSLLESTVVEGAFVNFFADR